MFSAGNAGRRDPAANYWASLNPAAIRVAGVLASRGLHPSSNYGAWTDIGAPFEVAVDNGTVYVGVGTSVAAPLVAGTAAVLLSHRPALTPMQVKKILMSTGTRERGLNVGCGCVLNAYRALIAAGYRPPRVRLTVTKNGRGLVTSATAQIRCGARCARLVPWGKAVRFTAKPATGWTFDRWKGLCRGTRPTCVLRPTRNGVVVSIFARRRTT